MEKEARINSLFGETIFHSHINLDNVDYIKHIESFVKEKPGRTAATTDVKGNTEFTDLEEAMIKSEIERTLKDPALGLTPDQQQKGIWIWVGLVLGLKF